MKRFTGLLAIAVVLILSGELKAKDYTWAGPMGQESYVWADPANWGGSGYPQGGDKVSFPNNNPDCCGKTFRFADTIMVESGKTLTIWGTSTSPTPTAIFDGGFSGGGSVALTGGLQPTLPVQSTLSGGMAICDYQSATVGHVDAFGTGPVSISGKTVYFTCSGTITNDFSWTRTANNVNFGFEVQPSAARQKLVFTGNLTIRGGFAASFVDGCEGGQTLEFRGRLTAADSAVNRYLFQSYRNSKTPTVKDRNRFVFSGGIDAPNVMFSFLQYADAVWNTPGETWMIPAAPGIAVPSGNSWDISFNRMLNLVASNGTIQVTRAIGEVNATSYPLVLSCFNEGRIELAAGATYASVTTVKLADTGSFICDNARTMPAFKTLALATGTLFESREDWTVRDGVAVTLDGAALSGAFYTSDGRDNTTARPELGEHLILRVAGTYPAVTPVAAVWTGLGPDSALKTPGNWEGSVAPDFTTGAAKPVFNAAATPCVTENASVAGFNVTAGTTAFTATGGATLTVASGTSELAASAAASFAGPVAFSGGHFFTLGLGARMTFSDALAGTVPGALAFVCPDVTDATTDPGRVTFEGPHTLRQDLFFTNVFVTARGTNPFGDGFGKVVIRSTKSYKSDYSNLRNLVLEGATIPNDIDLYHDQANFDKTIYCAANTTNRLDGYVRLTNGKSRYLYLDQGSVLTFTGGIAYYDNNFYISTSGTGAQKGLMVVTNKPYVVTGNATFGRSQTYALRLETSGNVFNELDLNHGSSASYVTIAAPNAISGTTLTSLTRGTIDLGGYDTTFVACPASGANGIVTSATPASICFSGNATNTVTFTLQGLAGVKQGGKGKTIIGSSQVSGRGAYGAYGSGVLALAADVKLRAETVTLADSGALELTAGSGFARKIREMTVTGAWKVRAGDADTILVRRLVVDGVPQRVGTYTSADFPDNIESGSITVSVSGFALSVR